MQLKLYNSVTKQKETFKPLITNSVSMYVCGPTVYSAPHLGNGLSNVVFDILFRLLIYIYGENNVKYVRNITDVDDKINDEAIKRGISINKLTEEITAIFHDNAKQLGCLKPTIEPKVTDHIKEIIKIIELLIENEVAYIANDHVYFAVKKYADYGKLAGRNIDEMIAGIRIEIAESKRDPADFVLWKPATDNSDKSAIFDSPWGKGRPGWHIECSAMSHKYLGPDFDIHGGGVDLIFPHHTNEIAQSCCAFKGSKYANFWVHNGFLTVNGEKMSKSLGNFITIKDLVDKGINGEIIRYHLSSTHYRKPMDWNDKAINDAKIALDNFYRAIEVIENQVVKSNISSKLLDALFDDLNTPVAFAVLHDLASKVHKAITIEEKEQYAHELKASAQLLGLLRYSAEEWFRGDNEDITEINTLIEARIKAKQERNFSLADKIRNDLLAKNIILEDKANGTTIWRKN